MNIEQWIPLIQTILWIIVILGLIIIYRKTIKVILNVMVEKLKSSKNLKIGPISLESSFRSVDPKSKCHEKVSRDWKEWIKKENIEGDVSGVFHAIENFQKSVLDNGCEDYDYALDLKEYGRYSTMIQKVKKDDQELESDSKEKIISSTLEIGDHVIHKTWKAMKKNDSWEIRIEI